jgi:membrane protease subunit HflK
MSEQHQENESEPLNNHDSFGGLVQPMAKRVNRFVNIAGFRGDGLYLLASLCLFIWIAGGVYKVQPDEQGVVLRFGQRIGTTEAGLHYHMPYPIETVLLPKVTKINQLQLGHATPASSNDEAANTAASRDKQMLTGDENIVEADCAVFWKIKDAGQFLFSVDNPELAIKISAESALREIIGRTPIQAALSDKRQQIAEETKALLQHLLDEENAGVLITQIQLQRVDPPGAVIDAFNDVQRARADQERARNEAESYANDIIPRARGEASHIMEEAQAYKVQAVDMAEGEAKSFLAVYQSYAQAKDVTSWRMYMESADEVLKKASKVIIDTSGKGVSSVVPYMSISEKDKVAPKEKKQ